MNAIWIEADEGSTATHIKTGNQFQWDEDILAHGRFEGDYVFLMNDTIRMEKDSVRVITKGA
jgi:hypothetical protein